MSESSNDQKIAFEWIKTIEDPSSQYIREKDIYPRLVEWVDSVSPSQILEIGSGQGICSSVLNLQHKSYTGVEPSPLLVERAQTLYKDKNKNFIIGTAENLPVESSSYEAVFSIAVWHLLKDLDTAAKELARVLKPNGSFLIMSANPEAYPLWTTPYKNSLLQGQQFKGDLILSDGSIASETLYLHSRQEVLESLSSSGLKITNTYCFRQVDQHQMFIQIEGQKTAL